MITRGAHTTVLVFANGTRVDRCAPTSIARYEYDAGLPF